MTALVSADPPSLRGQSPESLWRLLILDAWRSGLLHHFAKVATGNGSGGGEPVDFIKEQILKMWILAL